MKFIRFNMVVPAKTFLCHPCGVQCILVVLEGVGISYTITGTLHYNAVFRRKAVRPANTFLTIKSTSDFLTEILARIAFLLVANASVDERSMNLSTLLKLIQQKTGAAFVSLIHQLTLRSEMLQVATITCTDNFTQNILNSIIINQNIFIEYIGIRQVCKASS